MDNEFIYPESHYSRAAWENYYTQVNTVSKPKWNWEEWQANVSQKTIKHWHPDNDDEDDEDDEWSKLDRDVEGFCTPRSWEQARAFAAIADELSPAPFRAFVDAHEKFRDQPYQLNQEDNIMKNKVTIEDKTYVNGMNIQLMGDADLIAAIERQREHIEAIKKLDGLGSRRIENLTLEAEATLKRLVELLDNKEDTNKL